MQNQTHTGAALLQPRLVRKFFDLPLGTRFCYPGSKIVWVSLERHGCGKIAQWTDVDQWHAMQAICSMAESEEECRTVEVELVDLPNADVDASADEKTPTKPEDV
jgi:hypothetical protein